MVMSLCYHNHGRIKDLETEQERVRRESEIILKMTITENIER